MQQLGVYDNPDTGCRELYSNGHLVCSYTEDDLINTRRVSPLQELFLSYAKSLGPYCEGQDYGYEEHIPADTLATAQHLDDIKRTIGH